jgi:hypothetical protein
MSESARIFVLARNRKTGAVTYSGTYGQREEWHDSNSTQEVRVITVGAMWDAAPNEKNNDKATLREIVLWTLDRHRNDVGDYLDLSDEELQAVYARAKKGEEA